MVGVVLALMLWGPLRGCSGVTVEREEAVAAARLEINFEPDRVDAKLLRQGWSSTQWVVVFTVRDPDGGTGRISFAIPRSRCMLAAGKSWM